MEIKKLEKYKRVKEFDKADDLESFLKELNMNLSSVNEKYKIDISEKYSKIFLFGALRSGSTLFTQWLADTGLFSYPTNLLSRFYGAPLVGARIQQLLTDPKYNFRNEILDFNSKISFESKNGKTKGALSPNEFWYFWRRFLPFDKLDFVSSEELKNHGDLLNLRDELNVLSNIFNKPFSMKAMIMNQNIIDLYELFDKGIYIWIKRNPIFNVQSALEARIRQYGSMDVWYSFKIKEYPQLKEVDPLNSVIGQICSTNNSIEQSFLKIPENKKMVVQYEDFCINPEFYYESLISKIKKQEGYPGIESFPTYQGASEFVSTNEWRLKEYTLNQVADALGKF